MEWLIKSARAALETAKAVGGVAQSLGKSEQELCASLLRQLEALESALLSHAESSSEKARAANPDRFTIDG